MENRVETSLLMEYYGMLLTEKQRVIMGLYYDEDFSLSEIAELNQTSRQAIHDLIKRTHGQLVRYEEKLGMKKLSETLEQNKKLLLEKLEAKNQVTDEIRHLIDAL